MQRVFDKYGPLVRFEGALGNKPLIILADPETAAHVSITYQIPEVKPS